MAVGVRSNGVGWPGADRRWPHAARGWPGSESSSTRLRARPNPAGGSFRSPTSSASGCGARPRLGDAPDRWTPSPWRTCDAVLSEALHLLGSRGGSSLVVLLRRGALAPAFGLSVDLERVLTLLQKYADMPMSLADACPVRMQVRGDPGPSCGNSDRDVQGDPEISLTGMSCALAGVGGTARGTSTWRPWRTA